MHKARSFFFVCAGIFLLAAAYHLGAKSATAQGGSGLSCASMSISNSDWVVTTSGAVIRVDHDNGSCLYSSLSPTVIGQINSSSPIIAFQEGCSSGAAQYAAAYAQDGGVYWSSDGGATWSYRGNVLAGPTPATRATWGEIKSKYRPDATTQDK